MKLLFPTISLFVLIIQSCGSENIDEYMVDISNFDIQNDLIEDGEKVKILGASGRLTEEHEINFYNLVVVKSLQSGDTINVLMTSRLINLDGDPVTRFVSNTSNIGKILEKTVNGEAESISNLEDLKSKTFDKVFYDTEYIQVDVLHYPAVTGSLGKYRIEGDLDILK